MHILIRFILEIRGKHSGVAIEGSEVKGRPENGHFEGVKICIEKPLSIIS